MAQCNRNKKDGTPHREILSPYRAETSDEFAVLDIMKNCAAPYYEFFSSLYAPLNSKGYYPNNEIATRG